MHLTIVDRTPGANTPRGEARSGESAGGGAPALDTYANRIDESPARTRFEKRLDQASLRSSVRKISQLPRVRKCGHTVRRQEGIGIVADMSLPSEKRISGFRGLYSCASVWACPRCSAVIGVTRVAEVRQALRRWRTEGAFIGRRKKLPLIGPLPFDAGFDPETGEEIEPIRPLVWGKEYTRHAPGDVAFLTLTIKHTRKDALEDLWASVSEAWKRTTRGNWMLKTKVPAYIRSAEITAGKNGFHLHLHVLLFVEKGFAKELVKARKSIFDSWAKAVKALGFSALAKAQDLRFQPDQDEEDLACKLAQYTTKQSSKWDLALELNGALLKRAGGGNLTPRQMLAVLHAHSTGVETDFNESEISRLRALYMEFELASHGKRQLTWSAGAKKGFLVDEVEDEQLAETLDDDDQEIIDDLDQGTTEIAGFPGASWRYARQLRSQIQYAAETSAPDQVADSLRAVVDSSEDAIFIDLKTGVDWQEHLAKFSNDLLADPPRQGNTSHNTNDR